MGYAIAEKLADEGAEVILVSGPVSVSTKQSGIKIISVESAEEMYTACVENFPECDGAVMTAAVADFSPANPLPEKNKRGKENWLLELKPTHDIAAALGKLKKNGQLLVGFALETTDEKNSAQNKLRKKNLDFIVLNSLKDRGAGFGVDTNKITIIDKDNNQQAFELKSKKEVAADIVEKMILLLT